MQQSGSHSRGGWGGSSGWVRQVVSRAWEQHSAAIWAMAKRPAPHGGEAPQPGVAEYLASFHADAADAAARLDATQAPIRWDALRCARIVPLNCHQSLFRNRGCAPDRLSCTCAENKAADTVLSVLRLCPQ